MTANWASLGTEVLREIAFALGPDVSVGIVSVAECKRCSTHSNPTRPPCVLCRYTALERLFRSHARFSAVSRQTWAMYAEGADHKAPRASLWATILANLGVGRRAGALGWWACAAGMLQILWNCASVGCHFSACE